MRKLFLFMLFITICLISCNDDTGLGSKPLPKNNFAYGEWEQIIKFDNEINQTFNIVFTENEFTFNMMLKNYYNDTYTGTYKLFYDNDNRTMIEFFSDEPKMNGILRYSFAPIFNSSGEIIYPEESVWFFNTENSSNFPVGGIYTKVLP